MGFAVTFTSVDPIQLLVWSAVINGIVAVPVMGMMMAIVTSENAMGRFVAGTALSVAGWGATGLMAVTVVALACSIFM